MTTSRTLLDLSRCILCPRECGVNRTAGGLGFCAGPSALRVARAALLYYEEPCISGQCGSGAVFFTGCSLGCAFCQNIEIAGGMRIRAGRHPGSEQGDRPARNRSFQTGTLPGTEITPQRLSDILLELQAQGAANINLVTASHFLPLVIPALESARAGGLTIPIVYNTSSYEKPEAIRQLAGLVDIYLPDLKFHSESLSRRWADAPDYWLWATAALEEMVRQCPDPLFEDGSSALEEDDDRDIPLMKRGVIVRHLVMPGQTQDSREILRFLYETYGDHIFLSIMNQYTPMPQCAGDPCLSRPVTPEEYDEVVDFALSLGIENGFLQEGGTISQSFIPAWDGTGVLPAGREM